MIKTRPDAGVGWAVLKGLAAAAVLIAVCLAAAALRPAHGEAGIMAGAPVASHLD